MFRKLLDKLSRGKPGESAYEIAVRHGFKGSEKQWLKSLHGEYGIAGAPGMTGAMGPPGPPGVTFPEKYTFLRFAADEPENDPVIAAACLGIDSYQDHPVVMAKIRDLAAAVKLVHEDTSLITKGADALAKIRAREAVSEIDKELDRLLGISTIQIGSRTKRSIRI